MHTVKFGRLCRILVALLAATFSGLWGTVCTAQGIEQKPGSSGIDLAARDTTVRPGDDFYRYANGHWLATQMLGPDRARWGAFDELSRRAGDALRAVIEDAIRSHPEAGSGARKMVEFYQTYLDTQAIDAHGLAPALPELTRIAALTTHEQVAALIATPGMLLDGPISCDIALDQKNPDRYVVVVGQSGLSLPDRQYYVEMLPELSEIRARFQTHVAKMLMLAGHPHSAEEAAQIMAFESAMAQLEWDSVVRRNRDLIYNPMSRATLQSTVPGYPWEDTFKALGLDPLTQVVVAEKSAISPLARLFRQTPVATLRNWLVYQFLTVTADVLPKAFRDENFDFYGRILEGQPEQPEREERALAAVDATLGDALGELYVAKNFPPQSKAGMEALVENLRRAYAQRIQNVPWMTPETRQLALQKLAALHPKIGYPSRWRDYSALDVRAGDALGNMQRAEIFEWQRERARLDKPSDREEWSMTPQTVNAYYNPVFNEVVFPAAILQPPLFNPTADAAVNYGGIGAAIGHEMSHGFDDQGAKSDARGVLRTWWRPADMEAFRARTEQLAAQYDQFKPFPDLHVNGHLTLGENIGDLGGLAIAYDAYRLSLKGATPPVIDGLTGDQRFFLSWAQAFRALQRDAALRNQVLSDTHSPEEYRVNGPVRNIDAWYAAFGVKPGDKLYLPPAQRVHIW